MEKFSYSLGAAVTSVEVVVSLVPCKYLMLEVGSPWIFEGAAISDFFIVKISVEYVRGEFVDVGDVFG